MPNRIESLIRALRFALCIVPRVVIQANKRRKIVFLFILTTSVLLILTKNDPEQQSDMTRFIFATNNCKIVKVLELRMKDDFPDSHTTIRHASFSKQYTMKADILCLQSQASCLDRQSFSYSIDELAFGITTTVDRVSEIILNLQFWTQHPGVRCLITFHYSEIDSLQSLRKMFEGKGIPCITRVTFIRRYEERFLDLVNQTWNLIGNDESSMLNKSIKWLLIGDDDTLWFLPNLLRTLNKYDWKMPMYIGDHSDSRNQLKIYGTYYAYGGGGIVFSRPTAQALAQRIIECNAYKTMYGGDMMLGKCVTEKLEVNLTRNENFHQMDIRGDATGFFESGIQGLLSIHHMFSWWSPMPKWTGENREEIVRRFRKAYQSTGFSFLKRYVWIDSTANQTLVLTLGYSVAIYNKILSLGHINSVEATFHSTYLVRKSRVPITGKKTWYFKDSFIEDSKIANKTTLLFWNLAPDSSQSCIVVRLI